jgi:ADP-heptose:LPS heptosyltransferase
MKIIISRTDAIGDVVLTLPVAGVLKALYPNAHVCFLGRAYTRDVVLASEHVDEFLDWDQWKDLPEQEATVALKALKADTIIHVFPNKQIARLAKRAGIARRIGTTNRIYHWWTCNTLVKLSRKNSPYHESQLNLKLLVPLGSKDLYPLDEIAGYYGLTRLEPLPTRLAALLAPDRFNLILHPKSRGHGAEWGLENFRRLITILPQDRYKIFLSGTAEEGKLLTSLIQEFPQLTDLTGKMSLKEFIAFIAAADGLVASGTGPLHLAAALDRHALGLFPPRRPIHPGRWAPVGRHAKFFVKDTNCEACKKTGDCSCIREIPAEELKAHLDRQSLHKR